jgi:cysteine-rich repeat protein
MGRLQLTARHHGGRSGARVLVFVAGLAVANLVGGVARAQSEGPNSPGNVVNDASFGTNPWNMTGNATVSDDLYANTSAGGVPTNYLEATDFGFSVPGTAVIDGIEVDVERRSAAGTVFDAAARIVKGGVVGAADRSIAGTWSTTDTVVTYGSNSDLWGETWTAADVNSSGFGFALSVDDSLDTAGVDLITITVYYSDCGDNQIGLSEDCDDGGVVSGDCCDSLCNFEASGSPCPDDGTLCTIDECDGAGTCGHAPPTTCKQALKSVIVIKDKSPDSKDKLVYKWLKGEMTSQAEYGTPTVDTDYSLCLYTGTTGTFLAQLDVPPGPPPLWKPIGTKGFKYKDKTLASTGVLKVLLKGNATQNGKSKAIVKGKGNNLPTLTPPFALPVTVQLVNDATTACFESVFDVGDVKPTDNVAGKFKGKAQ